MNAYILLIIIQNWTIHGLYWRNIVCHDYQEIKNQESTQVLDVGAIPRSLPVILKDDLVDIVKAGVLGTSGGGHDTMKIVDSIQDRGISQVYIIGGDGTQKGASVIFEEVRRRGLKVAIAGIPKTIDNDIPKMQALTIPAHKKPGSFVTEEIMIATMEDSSLTGILSLHMIYEQAVEYDLLQHRRLAGKFHIYLRRFRFENYVFDFGNDVYWNTLY
ncbi:hypothetical protein AgCh_012242 [Apium graveolens]